MQTATTIPATRVKIISQELCDAHGWTMGGIYDVLEWAKLGFCDANGQEIYILSVHYNRPVFISSNNYEIV